MKRAHVTYLPDQPEVFDSGARNVVYVKGRRAGGTMGAVNRLIELAHRNPGSRHLWVDTVQRNIDKLVARYFLPLLEHTTHKWRKSRHVLEFQGGSLCDFVSAQRPGNIEGFAYDCIWINEAGIVLRDENLYFQTLLPMVLESPRAQLFFIGAPKGSRLFRQMYDWGQDAARTDWKSFRHPSHQNPLLNRAELERQRAHMTERAWRQEILAEFVEGEGAVFRGLERAARALPEAEAAPGASYVLGVDLARYRDFTAIWVGRVDTLAAVHCERFRRLPWAMQVERIATLAKRYGHAPAFVDATGVGDPVCEELEAAGLLVAPVVLTAARKRQLIDRLAVLIEQERLSFVPHEQTLRELAAFEFHETARGHERTGAPPGGHDDCVIALALCAWGMSATGAGQEFILGNPMVTRESDW